MRHAHACWLIIPMLLGACSTKPVRRDTITFGHSSGGPAPIVTFVTIRSDGAIELDTGGKRERARVDPLTAASIIQTMHAEPMQAILSTLRAKGYRSGCCDQEDVYIQIGSTVTEAPVRNITFTQGGEEPELHSEFVLPEELVQVLKRVDALASVAFGVRYHHHLEPRRH